MFTSDECLVCCIRLLPSLSSSFPSKSHFVDRRSHILINLAITPHPPQISTIPQALVLGNPSSLADSTREGIETRLDRHPGLGVSVFCAGDEDQHIYGWRGTTVDHLHRHVLIVFLRMSPLIAIEKIIFVVYTPLSATKPHSLPALAGASTFGLCKPSR